MGRNKWDDVLSSFMPKCREYSFPQQQPASYLPISPFTHVCLAIVHAANNGRGTAEPHSSSCCCPAFRDVKKSARELYRLLPPLPHVFPGRGDVVVFSSFTEWMEAHNNNKQQTKRSETNAPPPRLEKRMFTSDLLQSSTCISDLGSRCDSKSCCPLCGVAQTLTAAAAAAATAVATTTAVCCRCSGGVAAVVCCSHVTVFMAVRVYCSAVCSPWAQQQEDNYRVRYRISSR